MRQQIVLPWRDTDEQWRRKHFNFLYDYYSREFDVLTADSTHDDFNRSEARNRGVEMTESEVAVIIDADNYIPLNQIWQAITKAHSHDTLVKPFRWFGYITEDSTNNFYDLFESGLEYHPAYIGPAVRGFTGGAYVMKKSLWQEIGGMDEGFVGWGAEDDAFHLKIEGTLGSVKTIDGQDYHLYHPAFRSTSEFNYNKLQEEYVKRYT